MKKEKFETYINQQIRPMEVDPPATVWENLEEKLEQPGLNTRLPKNKIMLWSFGLITLLILVIYRSQSIADANENVGHPQIAQTTVPATGPISDEVLSQIQNWQEEDRLLMLYFYREDCVYCKQLEEETFAQNSIRKLITDHFKMVSLNLRDVKNAAIVKKYQVVAYPTLLFLNEAGAPFYRIQGFRNEVDLQTALEGIRQGKSMPESETPEKAMLDPEITVTQQAQAFKMYPNPSRGQFKIEWTNEERIASNIQISAVDGKVVRKVGVPATEGPWTHEFDLSGVPKGYYTIRIERGGEVLVEKLLIQ